jgi:Fe-S cluster assembly protein SufD
MTQAQLTAKSWLDRLLSATSQPPAEPHAWLTRLRAEALERADSLTLPSIREEDWRFTDLSPLYKLAFKPVQPISTPVGLGLEPMLAPEVQTRLVFVDGHFVPALSATAPGNATVTTLAAGLDAHADLIKAQLGRHATFGDDAFRAINTAHLTDGAFVLVPRNTVASSPVQIIFATTQSDVAVHPRCLIVVEPGSDLTVLEDYVGLNDATYCVNAVTEIVVGANARVRHTRRQLDTTSAFHIASGATRLERDATFESVSIALGGRISRYNVNVRQAGEGVSCQLDGLALITGRQLADTHSFVDHAAPHGTSRQLHKCVVGGYGHAVFNGRILVREGAQLTDSAQESRNLLLSSRAHVDTKPQLEIFADDVKCSHGAAVGQLDTEEIFYLRSRGMSEPGARRLLTYGFAAEIVNRAPLPSVADALRRTVLEQTESEEAA